MRIGTRLWSGFWLLCSVLGCAAAGATPPVLNGYVEYETFGYPDPETTRGRWENFFAATGRGRGQFTPMLSWQFEGRAVADNADFTAGAFSARNEMRRRPYLSLTTALVDYRPAPSLRASIGKQTVNWSNFDAIQPANLMTPRDESDAFRRIEQGVYGVSVHYASGSTFAELVVVPLAFTPSRLPQGRWNITNSVGGAFNGQFIEEQDLPPVRPNETQAGARVGTHVGALEASLLGYVGRDTAAIFVPQIIFKGFVHTRPVFESHIIDQYPQTRAGGVTATYPLGDQLLLRAEAVYFNSPERNRDDFLHELIGVEYALADWRVVVNYFRDDQTIAAHEEVLSKGERRFFQSFVFGEIHYDAGGRLQGRLRGGYDATGEFFLLQPEVSCRVWQGLRVALFGEVIDADRLAYEDNAISYSDGIRHEDRLGTRLEYDF